MYSPFFVEASPTRVVPHVLLEKANGVLSENSAGCSCIWSIFPLLFGDYGEPLNQWDAG